MAKTLTPPIPKSPYHPDNLKKMGASVSSIMRFYRKGEATSTVDCSNCNSSCCRTYRVEYQRGDDLSLFVQDDDGRFFVPKGDNGACVHLTAKGCGVYDRRPASCRTYDCRPLAIVGAVGTNPISMFYQNHAACQWDVSSGIKTQDDVDTLVSAWTLRDRLIDFGEAEGLVALSTTVANNVQKKEFRVSKSEHGMSVESMKAALVASYIHRAELWKHATEEAMSDIPAMIENVRKCLALEPPANRNDFLVRAFSEAIGGAA